MFLNLDQKSHFHFVGIYKIISAINFVVSHTSIMKDNFDSNFLPICYKPKKN